MNPAPPQDEIGAKAEGRSEHIIREQQAEEIRRLREALEKIEGGWIGDEIEEDDNEAFVVALQNIARAALNPKEPT